MGILNGRHVFVSKFVTAIIIDDSGRGFFVPIKHVVGDYFLVNLNNQTYAFQVFGERVFTYRHTLAKTFQFIIYFTRHYRPISPDSELLKLFIAKNKTPRINALMSTFLKFLGRSETAQFKEHDINKVITTLQNESTAPETTKQIISYIAALGVDHIVTPVRSISEYIEDDLKATDPKFLGSLATSLEAADHEHKKITNTPINAKKPILKVAVIGLLIMMVGFSAWLGYEEGWFDSLLNIGDTLPSAIPTPTVQSPEQTIMEQYPNPEDLKQAVESGKVDEQDLPSSIRDLLKTVAAPGQLITSPIETPSDLTP